MKSFFLFVSLIFTTSCFSQKLSFDIGSSFYHSTAISETEFSGNPLYNGIDGRSSIASSFQLNYTVSENLILQTGLGVAMYRYEPLTDILWPSQFQNGAFRDIGFDENGLVENTYLSVPIGIGSTLEFGKITLHPQFQFKFNYSLRDSPLISLDENINKSFLTGSLSVGLTVLKLNKLSLILAPFVEMKPYDLEFDHAYSDEKLLLAGFGLIIRCQKGNDSLEN